MPHFIYETHSRRGMVTHNQRANYNLPNVHFEFIVSTLNVVQNIRSYHLHAKISKGSFARRRDLTAT
jgi:hypothetical protein